MVRLNKFISSNSYLSRRKADEAVFGGRVKVNGIKTDSPAVIINETDDNVCLDGHFIKKKDYFYIKFYKPAAVLTSYNRDGGKMCLIDFDFLAADMPAYSGRLDYESEGLIIFSNDGDFIQNIQKPKFRIPKEYIVYTKKHLSKEDIKKLKTGIRFKKTTYKPCEIEVLGDYKYKFVIYEGKNRQIRNMVTHCSNTVTKLVRTKIGNIEMENLKPGNYKYLQKNKIKEINIV